MKHRDHNQMPATQIQNHRRNHIVIIARVRNSHVLFTQGFTYQQRTSNKIILKHKVPNKFQAKQCQLRLSHQKESGELHQMNDKFNQNLCPRNSTISATLNHSRVRQAGGLFFFLQKLGDMSHSKRCYLAPSISAEEKSIRSCLTYSKRIAHPMKSSGHSDLAAIAHPLFSAWVGRGKFQLSTRFQVDPPTPT